MIRHTKGPWRVLVDASGAMTVVDIDGRDLIRNPHFSPDRRAANARTMAAAPVLAEAVRLACAALARGHKLTPLGREAATAACVSAIAAMTGL